jgi:hypothetical protein
MSPKANKKHYEKAIPDFPPGAPVLPFHTSAGGKARRSFPQRSDIEIYRQVRRTLSVFAVDFSFQLTESREVVA